MTTPLGPGPDEPQVESAAREGVGVDNVVTHGTFSLDGGTWEVDNNVWIVGDDTHIVIIDPAHDAAAILAAVGTRTVDAVICTHAHDDHIGAVADVVRATGAPVFLHPADRMLWDRVYPERPPDRELEQGMVLDAGNAPLSVLHTPGHSPGSVCLYAPNLGVVFSGDTLFAGGPGATGRSYSDFSAIIDSIRNELLTLPATTVVHPGHGPDTIIEAEAPQLQEWIDRGH